MSHNLDIAAAILDTNSNIIYRNAMFKDLSGFVQSWVAVNIMHLLDCKMSQVPGWPYEARVIKNKGCYVLHLHKINVIPSGNETLLKAYQRDVKAGKDEYKVATQLLSKYLGWRYAAVVEFDLSSGIKFLEFWDKGCWFQIENYPIRNTPCELALHASDMTFLTQVQSAFPEATLVADFNVESYASLMFRDTNNKPAGHIMLMHDQSSVNVDQTERCLRIMTMALGALRSRGLDDTPETSF